MHLDPTIQAIVKKHLKTCPFHIGQEVFLHGEDTVPLKVIGIRLDPVCEFYEIEVMLLSEQSEKTWKFFSTSLFAKNKQKPFSVIDGGKS